MDFSKSSKMCFVDFYQFDHVSNHITAVPIISKLIFTIENQEFHCKQTGTVCCFEFLLVQVSNFSKK